MRLLFFSVGIASAIMSAAISQASVVYSGQDREALPRGATFFINHCNGCHSLRYMRYNRLASDLGLISLDGAKARSRVRSDDPIRVSMPLSDAREWFGVIPPDLSLIAREKGPAWIVRYLKSFYADSSRPFASNNSLVPDTAMPNVLEPLRGHVIAMNRDLTGSKILQLQIIEEGQMTTAEFDRALKELATFLDYVAEPERGSRYLIGTFVLLFLFVFLLVVWQLKRWYWQRLP